MNEKQMRYAVNCQSLKTIGTKLFLFMALFFATLTVNAGNVDINKRVTLKVENESIKKNFSKN
ncbi:hypothetical protein [Flavobacterium sp. CGRL2]